jgi:hypothetical protein
LGAKLIVGGQIEHTPENIILDLDIQSSDQGDRVFCKRIITPLTLAMETLKAKAAVGTEAIFGEDNTVWVKDGNSQLKTPDAWPGKAGYSYPASVYCPQAQYSAAAVKAKIMGTLVLSVVIGADGDGAKDICATRASMRIGSASDPVSKRMEIQGCNWP